MEILEKANRALSRISEKIFLDGDRNGDQDHLPTMKNLDKGDDIVTYTLQAVAHKIRNPLLAVGGFARRLSDSLDPETSTGKYIRIILEESERLEKALSEMTHETTAP
jgi:nitrogen-specific signal transduction histidine kinase